jgi:hypothetical protein
LACVIIIIITIIIIIIIMKVKVREGIEESARSARQLAMTIDQLIDILG